MVMANQRWVCFTGVPLFCGMKVFSKLGEVVEGFAKVSPQTIDKKNLCEV